MKAISIEDAIRSNAPFTVKMDNGETFCIKHPDYMLLSPGKTTAVFFHEDDRFEIIDLEHVSSITAQRRKR